MHDSWKNSAADPRFRILQEPLRATAPSDGITVWRSARELSGEGTKATGVFDEFPAGASDPPDEPTRRHFLEIMGASLGLAGVAGCNFEQPQETIVPFVNAPEHQTPGVPLYFATATTWAGASLGLLVKSQMGRPVKVEGNPLHPAVPEVMAAANEKAPATQIRFGATDAFSQALVLSLYDPDRSQTILRGGQIDTWDACYSELRGRLDRLAENGGQGLRLLTEPIVSPTLAGQMQQLLAAFPNARWHQYAPVNDDNATLGARLAFGQDVAITYKNRPDVVLSLDADFFSDGPMKLQLARNFRWHDLQAAEPSMNRLYVAETSATITGAAADNRLGISPRGVVALAVAVARGLGLADDGTEIRSDEVPESWVKAVVEDLTSARGRCVVLAGRNQPPIVHALAHWMNDTLGNVGQTVEYRTPIAARPELAGESIRELADAMGAGQVEALVILGGNPAFDAPADLKFAESLADVSFTLRLGQYADETSERCLWHVPEPHLFESWSDTRAGDGTVTITQPLIAPLYDGKSAHQLLAALAGNLSATSYDLVRAHWQQGAGGQAATEFERVWKTAVHDGILAGTQAAVVTPMLRPELSRDLSQQIASFALPRGADSLQIVFRPDASVWDGRFANSAWLQEAPRPLTKLTWDNVLLISPETASQRRIKTGDVVEIESGGIQLELPAYVLVRHPEKTLTVQLGYGRQRAGRVGNNVGTNVYPLRNSGSMWFADVANIRNTGRTYTLAFTQHHHNITGRDIVRNGTLEEYRADPAHPAFMAAHHEGPLHSFYPEPVYEGNKWGMVINQSSCVGCNACVVACQAENNIPVVGKDQVWRGREMHWLRIDTYYEEGAGGSGLGAHDRETESTSSPQSPGPSPHVFHQPMLCQHCELAPCEPVCPVGATTHSDEGLNEMTYNRCIGTRYCANNCPYKVRRFNFFDYNTELREDPVLHLLPNPNVTVRSRGVMEKCTYCVQRINTGRIDAKKQDRPIRDGEVITACQSACPTQAIVFGNLNDPESAVSQAAASGLNYTVLGDLNTRPRTTYLGVVRNPKEIE